MHKAIKELYIPYKTSRAIMGAMLYLPEIDNDNALVTAMQECGHILGKIISEEMKQEIQTFKENSAEVALVIRGLPVDQALPPTPYHGKQSLQSIPLIVGVNLALYDLLKLNPVTYWGENEGHLFRHVIPCKNATNEKSSHGSMYTLGMHVDNCHLPLIPEKNRKGFSACPEYLSLFGIRTDLKVFTKLGILDEAIKQLTPEAIAQLTQPNFILKMPDSFVNAKSFELPILIPDENGFYYARFDKEYTTAKTNQALNAFTDLSNALLSKSSMHHFLLQAGDFLIFKNQRVTHSRENFTPRFDGTDRWLLRLFGISNLECIIPVEKTKPYCLAA